MYLVKSLRGCNNKTFYKSIVALDRTAVLLQVSSRATIFQDCYQWKISKVMITFYGFQTQNINIEALQRARKTFESFWQKLSDLLSMLFQFFVFASKHRKFHHGIDYSIILQAFISPLSVMQFKGEFKKWQELALQTTNDERKHK